MAGGTTRRELFRLGAGLLAGAAVASPGRAGAPLDVADAVVLARGWLRDPEAARALGERYLALHPEDADPTRLLHGSLGSGSADAAAARFARLRGRDFATGETVELAGWRMSRSEARLCALLTLVAPTNLPGRSGASRPR